MDRPLNAPVMAGSISSRLMTIENMRTGHWGHGCAFSYPNENIGFSIFPADLGKGLPTYQEQ
jgi:hypothetical protein